LNRRLMTDMAETIADFHQRAEIEKNFGGFSGMKAIIDGNKQTFADYGEGVVTAEKLAQLNEATAAALGAAHEVLDQRREGGFVRQCHGDLHLRNIVMIDGKPTLFDAIEFNDAISNIDVFYDLAFLMMDLDHLGLRRLANITFNRYLDVTCDLAGLPVLPLFLSVRAAIRAHVSTAMVKTVSDAGAKTGLIKDAGDYLEMAIDYLSPPPPRLVAVGGLSGSGKSRMGRELAPYLGAAPGARVARSDVLRKRLVGTGPLVRLGPEGYSREMTDKTYGEVYTQARRALAAGHSVITDAVFAKPDQRAAIQAVADEVGAPFDGLWLEAPEAVMADRVTRRQDNASDADAEILRQQLAYDIGPMEWTRVDSSGSRESTLDKGLRALNLAT